MWCKLQKVCGTCMHLAQEGVAPAFSSRVLLVSLVHHRFRPPFGPFFPPITARATYQNSKLLASATGTGGGGGGEREREMTELVKGGWGGGLNLFWGGQWGRKLGLFECEWHSGAVWKSRSVDCHLYLCSWSCSISTGTVTCTCVAGPVALALVLSLVLV